MNLVQTAAYDPLFWLHHSFIDKVWADRQNNPDLPQMTNEELKNTMLEPFRGNLKTTFKRNLIIYFKTTFMPEKIAVEMLAKSGSCLNLFHLINLRKLKKETNMLAFQHNFLFIKLSLKALSSHRCSTQPIHTHSKSTERSIGL